jgi:hypothetical protein
MSDRSHCNHTQPGDIMNFLTVLTSLAPLLEPVGEEGVNALFATLNAEIAKIANPDAKAFLVAISPAIQGFLIAEVKKL